LVPVPEVVDGAEDAPVPCAGTLEPEDVETEPGVE
jgi:hypothetical protein